MLAAHRRTMLEQARRAEVTSALLPSSPLCPLFLLLLLSCSCIMCLVRSCLLVMVVWAVARFGQSDVPHRIARDSFWEILLSREYPRVSAHIRMYRYSCTILVSWTREVMMPKVRHKFPTHTPRNPTATLASGRAGGRACSFSSCCLVGILVGVVRLLILSCTY